MIVNNTVSPNLIIELTFPVVWCFLHSFKYSFVRWFQYDSNKLCKYLVRFDKLLSFGKNIGVLEYSSFTFAYIICVYINSKFNLKLFSI